MVVEITVPMLGDGMRDGVIAEWYAPDGAEVQPGERLYRLESNFVAIDIEAEHAGTLEHRLEAGRAHQPGSVVALILTTTGGEDAETSEPEQNRPPSDTAEDPLAPEPDAPWDNAMAGWAHAGAAERQAAHPSAHERSAPPEGPAEPPHEVHELPRLRPGTLHPEPAPANTAWDAVEGDQEFDPGWQKPVEPETDMFGFVLAKDDESEERVSGVLGFSLGQHRRRILPADASARPAEAAPPASGPQAVEIERRDEADEDDALPYTPEISEAAAGRLPVTRDSGGGAALPPIDWDRFEAPMKDPDDPAPASDDDAGDEATRPIPFPARPRERYRDEVEPATLQAPAMFLRVTVRMAEVRKLQAQLRREWQPAGAAPADEDIALRALARAIVESPALCALGDDVGVVLLEPEGESLVVLQGASGGGLQDQVVCLAQKKSLREPADCAYSITSFGPLGIEEGSPPLPADHPFALALGAVRMGFDGESGGPAPLVTLTLAFSAEQITVAQAAMLLGRVRDLMEAPFALLTE